MKVIAFITLQAIALMLGTMAWAGLKDTINGIRGRGYSNVSDDMPPILFVPMYIAFQILAISVFFIM